VIAESTLKALSGSTKSSRGYDVLKMRNVVRGIVLIVAAAALTGCAEFVDGMNKATAQQEAERNARVERDVQAIRDGIDRTCEKYGYKPGTDGFAGCRERGVNKAVSDMKREQDQAQARARSQAAWQRSLWDDPAPRSKTTTQCRPTGFGNYDCTSTNY
jgi:hypothetical protein